MTTAAKELSNFAVGLKFEDLSKEIVHKAKQMILDTLGCALGGYLSEPSRITRSVLRDLGGKVESTIIGTGEKTSSPNAALANCVMVRYLDFMDIYFSVDTSHPSENIPTALAVGEREHSSGKEVLQAVVIGFEVQGRFTDAIPLLSLGWHHVTVAGYTTPIVAGRLLGLNEEQMVHAIGISGSHNHALMGIIGVGEKGHGQISMMKAIGYGFGSQSGITAALLAQKGFTGPATIIESFNRVIADNMDLTPITKGSKKMRILDTCIKPFAAEFMTHTPLEALLELVKKHGIKAEDVAEINLRTHELATYILAQPEAYTPQSRETADHSLPYCLAVGLIEGDLGPEQFQRQQWKDPKVVDLMSRIKISSDPELEKLYPPARPADIEVLTQKGERFRARVDYPKGDPHNPMTDDEVQAKFRKLASKLMGEHQILRIIETVYNIEKVDDIGELMELLVV